MGVFVAIAAVCGYTAWIRPVLEVPLLFPVMISILVAVVWIVAGVSRLTS